MEGDSASMTDRNSTPPGRRSSRTASISSDRASLSGYGGLLSPPAAVAPEPAYIAASAASQIVTNDHDSHADTWLESHGIEPSGETALVAPAALKLVNSFLDQLLFNFLSVSRSTSLTALRPAVAEVLKPKLAQDAISGADQELHEYLGGNEGDQLLDAPSDDHTNWDLELVWKCTRLRSMVYSSLGDLEEEDEDYYMEHEHLNEGEGNLVVSPAVAIFLTSILEFMGEQALVVAGQAAYHRLRLKHEKDLKDGTNMPVSEIAERVVVDETDMERVALDRTLGRLWRGWKKRVRSPRSSISISRSFSSDNMLRTSSRNGSISHDTLNEDDTPRSIAEVMREDERAAGIPLPMRDGDIREIEVPGLAPHYDDEEEEEAEAADDTKPRPKSMVFQSVPTPNHSEPHTPTFSPKSRQRSFSLPSSPQPTYKSLTPALTEDGASVEANELEEPKESLKDIVTDPEAAKPESHKGLVAGLVAGATAAGGVAAAGLKIITSGEGRRPRTADQDEFDDDFIEEEPQIMTSSRVSIGPNSPGMIPSPNPSIRSPSVHSVRSLRVIDVSSPRSPGPSGQGSFDGDNRLTRTSSHHSTLVASELQPTTSPIMRGRQSPLMRSSSGLSVNAGSIAEEKEEHGEGASDFSSDKTGLTQGMEMGRKPTTTDSEKAFVLAAAPAAKSNRETPIAPAKPAPYVAPVAAPLAPLREMTEGNPDIPEEPEHHEQRPGLQSRSRSGVSEKRNESSPTPSKARSVHKSSSSTSSHKLRPVRTSEDSMPSRGEDKGQSFEQLIRSDQTIQYTLTPQNMREIEGPDGTGNNSPKTINSYRSRSESGSASRSESRTGINKHTGLYSNPPTTAQSNRSRKNAPQARDAKVDRDSIGDFAEFIRSTGPPGASLESIPPRSTPGTAQGHKGANGSSRNSSTSLAKPGAQPVLPKRSMSSAHRARFQAREAVVPFGDNSSDLIDFIRQGPASQNNPRIPRTVAPFRTTMDSDQLTSAAPSVQQTETPTEGTRNSQASTTFSQNTISSNTALINKKAAPAPPPKMDFDEEDMMPKRKTRRVKDPYAIDFSDEEDEFGDEPAAPPPKPKRQEESLIDFLNNVPPPPQETPRTTSIFDEPSRNDLKKKASAPSLMSRFRSPSVANEPVPRIPTTYSNGTISNPGRKGSISNASQPRTAPQIQPVRMPAGKKTATSDLADFFRDSEPPPMPPTRRFVEEEQKPMGWSARFLGRRKKAAA